MSFFAYKYIVTGQDWMTFLYNIWSQIYFGIVELADVVKQLPTEVAVAEEPPIGIPPIVVVPVVPVFPALDALAAAAAAAAAAFFFCAIADVKFGLAPIITRNSW